MLVKLDASTHRVQPLNALQVGRAVAALAVVCHHAAMGTEAFVSSLPPWPKEILKHGYLGVDFFFVLSGFIMFYTSALREQTMLGGVPAAFHFIRRRLIRIFVPYLPIALMLVAAYHLLPSLSAVDREWSWQATLFLLPSVDPPALSVAWTLQHEMVFYFLFALLFFSNNFWLGCLLWFVAILAVTVVGSGAEKPLSFLLGTINLEFLFGAAAAWFSIQSGRYTAWLTLASVASIALFFSLDAGEMGGGIRVIFGLGMALILVPIVRLELAGKLTPAHWLVFLGNASYAIYLIHNPLISVTSRIAAHIGFLGSWHGALLFSIASSVVAGCLYHVVIEKPGLTFVSKLLNR